MLFIPYIVYFIAYLIGSIPFGLVLVRLAGKGDIRKIGSGNIGATNVLRTGSKGLAALTLLLDGGKVFLALWVYKISVGLFGTGFNNIVIGDFDIVYSKVPFLNFFILPKDLGICLIVTSVLIGHIFSIFLKFKGGKGVATALGAFIALDWQLGASACIIWLFIALYFRYSSLAAFASMTFTTAFTLLSAELNWFNMAFYRPCLLYNTYVYDTYNVPYRYVMTFSFSDCGNRLGDCDSYYGVIGPRAYAIILIALIVILRHHANIRRLLNGTEPKIGKTNAAA